MRRRTMPKSLISSRISLPYSLGNGMSLVFRAVLVAMPSESRAKAVIAGQFPAAGDDDFIVAIEGFIRRNEVETRIARVGRGETRITRIITNGGRGFAGREIGDAVERVLTRLDWFVDLDVDAAAETGAAVGESGKT